MARTKSERMILKALKQKRRAIRDDIDYAEWQLHAWEQPLAEDDWWEVHDRWRAFERELVEVNEKIDAAKKGDFSWVTI